MEFVAANERALPAENAVAEKPGAAIAEMELACGEAGRMAEQAGHRMISTLGVLQAWPRTM